MVLKGLHSSILIGAVYTMSIEQISHEEIREIYLSLLTNPLFLGKKLMVCFHMAFLFHPDNYSLS